MKLENNINIQHFSVLVAIILINRNIFSISFAGNVTRQDEIFAISFIISKICANKFQFVQFSHQYRANMSPSCANFVVPRCVIAIKIVMPSDVKLIYDFIF